MKLFKSKSKNIFDSKYAKLLIMFVGLIIVLIIGALILNIFKNINLSYEEIENKMLEATKDYYANNVDLLPVEEGDTVDIDVSLLATEGYMKTLSEYLDKDITCSGSITVTKSNNYYDYSPYLNCGDKYTTTYLYEKLLDQVVTENDGLYKATQIYDSKSNEVYVYRGEFPNNYLYIAKQMWRIVKIDSDNTIYIIQSEHNNNMFYESSWDNRYNSETKQYTGVNDYEKSRINDSLSNYYSIDEVFNPLFKAKIVSKPLCLGTRNTKDTGKDGKIECSNLSEPHYFNLLPVYDYLYASLDEECNSINSYNCTNYNYLTNYKAKWWLSTTNDLYSTLAFYIDEGFIKYSTLSEVYKLRVTTHLNSNLRYLSGTGTYQDPYKIK